MKKRPPLILTLLPILILMQSCARELIKQPYFYARMTAISPIGCLPVLNEYNIFQYSPEARSNHEFSIYDIDTLAIFIPKLEKKHYPYSMKSRMQRGRHTKIWLSVELSHEKKRNHLALIEDGTFKYRKHFYAYNEDLVRFLFRRLHPNHLKAAAAFTRCPYQKIALNLLNMSK